MKPMPGIRTPHPRRGRRGWGRTRRGEGAPRRHVAEVAVERRFNEETECTYVHMCVCAYVRTCVCAYVRTCVCVYVRMCVRTYVRTCVCANVRMCDREGVSILS